MSFKTLTPETMARELMHGDQTSLKRGYTAENAVIAVQSAQGLNEVEADVLLAHAQGFHDAVRTQIEPGYEPLIEDESEWSDDKRAAYERGHTFGLNADLDTIRIA